MFIQGKLQDIFDALHKMGLIDSALKVDWTDTLDQVPVRHEELTLAMEVVNRDHHDVDLLVQNLSQFDEEVLCYLAMEVGREYAEFHSRSTLH